ncbi:nucleotidyltransferase family protein [bacterium]|nr:nucleotidyltransferase family protein [bacterium]
MSVDSVILAAGYSSRMGAFKPGLDLGGKPVIIRTIESVASLADRIILVGGYNFKELTQLVCDIPKVELICNTKFEMGMFTSVKIGIAEVSAERFFLLPGDIPSVKSSTMLNMLEHKDKIIIPKYHGRKGHPVLFDSSLISDILAESDESNLRVFIHKKSPFFIEVEDGGILIDIDSPLDYEKLRRNYG